MSYTIRHSSQYMENHRAALPLAPQAALAVARTSAHGEMVFSIDETGALRVTVGSDDTPTGFTPYVLSGDFAALYPGSTVTAKAFAVAQDAGSGAITLVLAAGVAAAGPAPAYDEVWRLDGLANDPGAAWLTSGAARPWAKIAFDYSSPDLPRLVASTLSVADVRLSAAPAGAAPVAVVTVVDPGDQDQLPFFVTPQASPGQRAWTLLKPGEDYTETLDMAPGRPGGTLVDGLYLLVSYNQQTSLMFRPRVAAYPTMVFDVPAGATALCPVPVYQGGVPSGLTDLLVAGDGTLTLFAASGPSDAGHRRTDPGPVLTARVLAGVTALHAVVDGATIAVWGVNGGGQLFYTQAAYADRATPGAWSTPLPLLSGVVRGAPFLTETRMISALFAVVSDGETGESLVVLHKDPVTNGGATTWTKRQVHLPAPDQVLTLKTYTTKVMVLDETNMPGAGVQVGVSSGTSAVVEIGGSMVTLLPGGGQQFTTDAGGSLTIVQEVSSLAAPSYTFTAGSGTATTVDPTAGVRAQAAAIKQGSDLSGAHYVSASGEKLPVVDPTRNVTTTQLDAAVAGIQQATGLTPASGPAGAAAFALAARGPAVAAPSGVEGFISALGDLAQTLIADAESVVEVIVREVEEGYALLVTIGEEVFYAVIQTVEDVAHAVYVFLRAVWIDLETVFRWLAFLFDWGDILDFQRTLMSLYDGLIKAAPAAVEGLKEVLDGWFAHFEAQLADPDARSRLTAQVPAQGVKAQVAARQPTFQGQDGGDLRTDPRVGWAQSKLPASGGGTSLAATAVMPLRADDPLQPFVDALGKLLDQFADAFTELTGSISRLVDGTLSPGDWLASVGEILARLGLDVAQDVVDAVLGSLADLMELGKTGLEQTIEVPLLSALYKQVAGEPLSLLGLSCLMQSIVVTIAYKIATGESPASDLTVDRAKQVGATISRLPSLLPVAPSASASPAPLVPPRPAPPAPGSAFLSLAAEPAAGDDDGGPLTGIRGGFQILRALVMMVEIYEVPGPGGDDPAEATENLIFLIHFACRTGISATELAELLEDPDNADVAAVFSTFGLMYQLMVLLMIGFNQQGGGSRSSAVTAVREADYIISTLLGGGGLVTDIAEGCRNAAGILDNVAEVGDLAQHLAEEEPPASILVLMIRCFAMLAAGGINLGATTS